MAAKYSLGLGSRSWIILETFQIYLLIMTHENLEDVLRPPTDNGDDQDYGEDDVGVAVNEDKWILLSDNSRHIPVLQEFMREQEAVWRPSLEPCWTWGWTRKINYRHIGTGSMRVKLCQYLALHSGEIPSSIFFNRFMSPIQISSHHVTPHSTIRCTSLKACCSTSIRSGSKSGQCIKIFP